MSTSSPPAAPAVVSQPQSLSSTPVAAPSSSTAPTASGTSGASGTPSAQANSQPVVRRRRKQRYSRSRTGCLTCRQRKVKCDESRPVCGKCMDLEKECVWSSTSFLAFKPGSVARTRSNHSSAAAAAAATGGAVGPGGGRSGDLVPGAGRHLGVPAGPSGLGSAGASDASVVNGGDWSGRLLRGAGEDQGAGGGLGVGPEDDLADLHRHDLDLDMSPSSAEGDVNEIHAETSLLDLMNDPTAEADNFIATVVEALRSSHEHHLQHLGAPHAALLAEAEQKPTLFGLPPLQHGHLPHSHDQHQQNHPHQQHHNHHTDPQGQPLGVPDSMMRRGPPDGLLPHAQQGKVTLPDSSVPDLSSLQSASAAASNANGNRGGVSMEFSSLALRRGIVPQFNMGPPGVMNVVGHPHNSPPGAEHVVSISVTPANDPIATAYPSAAGRRLFNHFFNLTSSIVIAMGKGGPNDKVSARNKNPFLAVSLPLILHDSESPARAAFRLGVLSLGAAHLHHQYITSGQDEQAQQMLVETTSAKRQAAAHMILSNSKEGDKQIDLLLATCMTIKTRDILMADKSWKQNLDFGIRMMFKRGGPAALLAADPHNFGRRFVIEQLTTTDVFSTFTTGEEPILLGESTPWWFDFEKSAMSDWQWEAYERQFGMSRGMCELVARCRVIVYRKYRTQGSLPGDAGSEAIAETIGGDAWALIEELRLWSITQQQMPQRSRVLLGDSAYRYAMLIMLLTEVLGVTSTDDQIQRAVHCVLELCSEISMEPVMLIWPLLIAGASALGTDRQWVRDLFGIFRGDYCSDLVYAQKLMQEQWLRIDDGRKFTPWPQLMKETDCQVLLI